MAFSFSDLRDNRRVAELFSYLYIASVASIRAYASPKPIDS